MTDDSRVEPEDPSRSSKAVAHEDLEHFPPVTPALGGDTTTELLPARGRARTILHGLGMVEQAIGTSLIVVLLVLVLAQVAQRYIPGGYPWTGEMARLALVWCTFALSGYLMAHDRHIAIQTVDLILHGRALGLVMLLVHVVVLATCLAMAYAAYRLIADDIGQRLPASELPLAWTYVVPLVGFLLTALRAGMAIGILDIPEIRGRRATRA
jgi:TRAP-type C4-dicarboxylate transport system permease small subunit